MTQTLTPPWEATDDTDLEALPRDTIPRAPHGDSCQAEWDGTEDGSGLVWKCSMPADHEPEPHRAGNGHEVLAEWPSVRALDGPPPLGVDEVIDADGHRWHLDDESPLVEVWRCTDGEGEGLPPEVLAEVFGRLWEVLG